MSCYTDPGATHHYACACREDKFRVALEVCGLVLELASIEMPKELVEAAARVLLMGEKEL